MITFESFINGMSKEEFFRDYWETKPLVIKNAFKGANELASFTEFYNLMQEDDCETRVIVEDSNKWVQTEGPFNKNQLDKLLKKKSTFVAHSINTFSENFYQFEKMMKVIPGWIFDDVMGTYSQKDASVGPHYDNYNVFILQGAGSRLWKISEKFNFKTMEDSEIRILEKVNFEKEYILETGDMIYIPPQVAHHGISLEESLSYSIGFKSFSHEELLKNFFINKIENLSSNKLLHTKDEICSNRFEIHKNTIKNIKNIILDSINNESELIDFVGSFLTTPRGSNELNENLSKKEIANLLNDSEELFLAPHLKFSFIDNLFFINTKKYEVNDSDRDILKNLLNQSSLDVLQYNYSSYSSKIKEIVLNLVIKGDLIINYDIIKE